MIVCAISRIAIVTVAAISNLAGPVARELHAQDFGELALTKQTVLSSAAAVVAPSREVSVGRLSSGEYVVTFRFTASHQILKYDTHGNLAKQYDRPGQGPGEFRSAPMIFVGRGDTVIAREQARIVRLDGALNHVSTHLGEIGPWGTMMEFAPGAYVVTSPVTTNGGATWMMSIVDREGQVVQHIDVEQDQSYLETAVTAFSSTGGFWSARSNRSDLVLWSAQGKPVRTVSIDRPWFESWEGEVTGEPLTIRPRPRVVSIGELDSETIIVLTTVADKNWRPLGPPGQEVAIPLTTMDWSTIFDGVLEIVDAADGSVMARRTVGQFLQPVEGTSDHFFSTREDPDGHILIEIWRVVRARDASR